MKKKDVIRFIGQQKTLSKEARELNRKIEKLKRQYNSVLTIVRHLEYINVVDDVPVYVYATYGGFNIISSFEESNRSAFLEAIPETTRYRVKLLKSENNHLAYDKVLTKKQALCVAARWIDKGEVLK